MDQQRENKTCPNSDAFQYRMGLNDNKAGMEGLDKEKINKIIMDATKGSRFYDNELKKDQQLNQRIEKILQQKAQLTSSQIKKAQIQVDRLALELERRRDLSRVIVHVDMDAFYAAVEMRDNPELKEKPMAVGSMSMLSTSNYLARKFGVRAAMPGFIAKKLCPHLVIVPTNFDKYRAVSKEIREIFAEYDPNFLPLSLDEAYLDITDHLEERLTWPEERRRYVVNDGSAQKPESPEGNVGMDITAGTSEPEQMQCTSPVLFEDGPSFPSEQNVTLPVSNSDPAKDGESAENVIIFGTSAEEAVKEMRFRIQQKTTLTASAGIAPNMMLAKVCSDRNKPNGQYIIPHYRQAVMDFIKDLPIRKVPGIGKVTEKMLQALGVTDCTGLYQQRAPLSLLFSDISWHNFLHISLGLGSTHIEKDGERKSMSTERTFSEMNSAEEQYELCRELCKDLAEDLHKEGLKGRTITLKLKNVLFEVKTRASTVCYSVSTAEEIFSVAKEILKAEIDSAAPEPLRLRLMGVRVSGFISEDDGKHQKSITSFLSASKPVNKLSSDAGDRAILETQAAAPPRESFFDLKRAARQQRGMLQNGSAQTTVPKQNLEVTGNDALYKEKFQKHMAREQELLQNCSAQTPVSRQNPEVIGNDGLYKESFHINAAREQELLQNDSVQPSVSQLRDGDDASREESYEMAHNEDESEAPDFTCPICLVKRTDWDLEGFNKHIDDCLNNSPTCGNSETLSKTSHSAPYKNHKGGSPEVMTHDVHTNNLKNKMVTVTPCDDLSDFVIDKHTLRTIKDNKDFHSSYRESDKVIKPGTPDKKVYESQRRPKEPNENVESTPPSSSVCTGEGALICPVCNTQQHTTDLAAFNRHVDVCLNKGILEELKDDQLIIQKIQTLTNGNEKAGNVGRGNNSNKSKLPSKRPGATQQNPASKKAKTSRSSNTIERFFK